LKQSIASKTAYRYYDPSDIRIREINMLRKQVHEKFKLKLENIRAIPCQKTMESAESLGITIYFPDNACPTHGRHTAVVKTKYGWSHACCISKFNQAHTDQLEQLPHTYVMPSKDEIQAEYDCRIYELNQIYLELAAAKTLANNASKERAEQRRAEARSSLKAAQTQSNVIQLNKLINDLGLPSEDECDDFDEKGLMYA